MNDPYKIIFGPAVSEKGTRLTDVANQYVFKVAVNANKIEIKRAIESVYKVRVASVNTLTVHGKAKRYRMTWGKSPDWKKAFVKLEQGESISFV